MPILKQLVSHSNASKRRSRADLTAEMISAPLGDFRHTMHVGRGGDAFGDTTFLSTRSGEPPRETTTTTSQPDHHHHHNPPNKQDSPGGGGGPKLGLLSRTFRSSKRSQSVNRGDKYDSNLILPSTGGGSASYVKNAISLPYLNDEDTGRGVRLAKSVSSSPMRKLSEADGGGGGGIRPANGGGAMAAMATLDAEFDEHNFGELTDLPPSMPRGGGMKHAESIMSFHIDLGPSMLGDILSVMEKKGWEEDDLGYEEGKGSEGRGSPSLSPPAEDVAPARPPRSMVYQQQQQQKAPVDPYTPELRVRGSSTTNQNQSQSQNQYLDSCSVSSSGSAALDEQKAGHHHNNNNHHHHHHTGGGEEGGDTDSAKYSSPRGEDERDFSFMDEDDDEIRV